MRKIENMLRAAVTAAAASLLLTTGLMTAGTLMTARQSEEQSIAAVQESGFTMDGAITAEAATAYIVTNKAAVIQGSNVVVTATASAVPSSDDGVYHLIASSVNQADNVGTEVAVAYAGKSASFVFPLNKNTASSNLCKKFTVCVKRSGAYVAVSNAIYVQNPEATATHTTARRDHGKKGLLPESTLLHSGTVKSAGVQQITYNVLLGDILSGTGITYNYNGKTYTFSKAAVGQLDDLVPLMNNQGIQVTLILLNNWAAGGTYVHPLSRDNTSQNYYAFNTVDQAAVEKLEAVAAFLGERFSNTGHGTVDNWIVGNEINARSPWHYMTASAGINVFTAEYAKAFRIFYNGLKSANANCRVYTCVDNEYAVADSSAHYAGQTWLALFNQTISGSGNIGWDVAVHPYDYPLYDPLVWLQTTNYPTKVNHTQSSSYVTMANIDVFTDYMSTTAMLAPNGQVRSIICSEQGYVSVPSEDYQAAAVVYGYLQALNNQHIDAFILSREMDHQTEIAQGLAMGIRGTNKTAKKALSWYSTAETAATQAAASAIIGAPIATLLTPR